MSRAKVFCESKDFSGTMVRVLDEGAKPKLDSGWEELRFVQEVDKYKTKGKVQLLHDTYTCYHIAYSK